MAAPRRSPCLIQDGRSDVAPMMERRASTASRGWLPIKAPVHRHDEIGAGGGQRRGIDESACSRSADSAGAIRPRATAAARAATVTDANLELGYPIPASSSAAA